MKDNKAPTIFSTITCYFLLIIFICTIVPIVIYSSFTFSKEMHYVDIKATENLTDDVSRLESVFSTYMNKASAIAKDKDVIQLLSSKEVNSSAIQMVYTTLFSEFGSNKECQASLISIDGSIRLSTSVFPLSYDLKANAGRWESNNVLAMALSPGSPSLLISMGNRKVTETSNAILATIVSKVINEDNKVIGYLIIDVFVSSVKEGSDFTFFEEETLIDTNTSLGISLIDPSINGQLDILQSFQEDNYSALERPIKGTPFVLRGVVDTSVFKSTLTRGIIILVVSVGIGIILSILLALILSHRITSRMKMLTSSLKKVEKGDLDVVAPEQTGIAEFNRLSASFNIMTEKLNQLMVLNREEEEKLAEAELKELEAQLNPHFLFNTLNTIKSLASINGQKEIYTIALQLGKLLRESLSHKSQEVTVQYSIDFILSYLTIQKIRFNERLNYILDVDDSVLDFLTPRLILQPLVENAVVHGIEPKIGAGTVIIRVKDLKDEVLFVVEDDGVGFDSSDFSSEDYSDLKENGHIGVYNVYKRLELKYAKNMTFHIESKEDIGTKVTITIKK